MPTPLIILIILPLLGCLFSLSCAKKAANAFNLVIFTLVCNIMVMLKLFTQLDIQNPALQLRQSYEWIKEFSLRITFGVDAFSLVLLLSVYISALIGLIRLKQEDKNNKSLMLLTLYFIWNITGFFCAGDIISFYIFFAGMLLPLFMLVGLFGYSQKVSLYRFFMYNFIGVIALLPAIMVLYKFFNGNVLLSEISFVNMDKRISISVWLAVCLSFVSRIPIWPFHHWISSVVSGLKNPLVYIAVNLLPLVGIYGFVRFWPLNVPESIEILVPLIEILAIITMIFVALIAFVNHMFFYKIFSYSTIYYLLFLLAVILPTDVLKMNIVYSCFIFLIVTSSLIVFDADIKEKCETYKCDYATILRYMPNSATVFCFFALIAMGLPISSLFWNNFVLVSAIFRQNFVVGIMVMFALAMIAIVLMIELLQMFTNSSKSLKQIKVEDLSISKLTFLGFIILILMLSFFNPLWFVFQE